MNTLPAGFTKGIFGTMDECQNFIWGYLYDKGLQYHSPTILGNGTIELIYEDK